MSTWNQVWVILVKGPSGQWLPSGPFLDEELKLKVAHGELSLSTWVWRRGLSGWAQLSELQVFSSDEDGWRYEAKLRDQHEIEIDELKWSDRLEPGSPKPSDDDLGESLID